MAYIIKFEEKAVKDLAELKKAGNKAAIVKIRTKIKAEIKDKDRETEKRE